MVLRGILDKPFGSFLCLRGFCPLGDIAKYSTSDDSYQRPKIDDHIDDMIQFLNDPNDLFFPEVILGVSLDEFGVSGAEYEWLCTEALSGRGVSRKKLGSLSISIFAKAFTRVTGVSYVHNTASLYGLDSGNDNKLYRIDGNHRLAAALEPKIRPEILSRLIPFCLIFFRDKKLYTEKAATFFRNINFKVRPILEEYNLKIVLKQKEVFTEAILKERSAYGQHFVWARAILEYLEKNPSTILSRVYKDSVCTFLIRVLENVIKQNVKSDLLHSLDTDNGINKLVIAMEKAVGDPRIAPLIDCMPIAEALVYYKIKNHDEYNHFCRWIEKNNFSKIKKIEVGEIISLFDEIYKGIPKQLFLARWYPEEGEEKRKADARYAAIEKIATNHNLKLIDMAHESGGTFSIRDMIDQKLPESDIFVADLTGARPNVMIEVGMALHHIDSNRVLFYFQPSKDVPSVPFDISGFRYESIVDSSEILTKIEPNIKKIIDSSL